MRVQKSLKDDKKLKKIGTNKYYLLKDNTTKEVVFRKVSFV